MPAKIEGRPEKKTTDELFASIESALVNKNYYFTSHALQRTKERRSVSKFQVIRLLKSKTKYHEVRKDRFNGDYKNWNYLIRGKSIDAEDIRVILSFDENEMLIVTVINLDES